MDRESRVVESEMASATAEPSPPVAGGNSGGEQRNIHRIGGATLENLRLKPKEKTLNPPGISVIKAASPSDAAQEIRTGLPKAKKLHAQAKTIGSATVDTIKDAGFEVMPASSFALPNHHRIIHPNGVAGFSDENLARLAEVFVNTTGH